MLSRLRSFAALALGAALAVPAAAQEPLTLSSAVQRALAKSPLRRAAAAEQDAARAGAREARSAFFPWVGFTESFTRSNDPVFVFGGKLRQERFTASDFALDVLNTPAPLNNWATRFGAQWNLFDSGAKFHNLARASRLREAAGRQLARTEQELAFRVVEAYFGVLMAERQLEVGQHSLRTAEAIRDRSQARVEAGLVVEADLLSAQVNLADRQHQLVVAENAVKLVRARLNLAMGENAGAAFALTMPAESAPAEPAPLDFLEAAALEKRPDLRRLEAEQSAQESNVSAARSAFGPRLNVFAAWEADNRKFTGEGGNNWMTGVELQVDLFQGGAKAARLARERAIAERVSALRQAAEDAVRLDLRRAYYDLDSARRQFEVMQAARTQAAESLRIHQDRYHAGLNTLTDLLRVEETARRTQSDYWGAFYRLKTAYAALELAGGTLHPDSPAVLQ